MRLVHQEGTVSDVSTGPLLGFELDRGRALGRQIEEQLRSLIRARTLAVGDRLPSTRSLAADLGVSRGVVVGAYAQLAAEGYVELGRGVVPRVAAVGREAVREARDEVDVPVALARYNLRPDLPDLALFPRVEWLAASRSSLQRAANTDLAYGEPFGSTVLRARLAPFLARTRGVVATSDRTGIFAGSTHALAALASLVGTKLAVEDPSHRWRTRALRSAGVDVVPVPVDEQGLRVDLLPDDAGAVVVSPDHHFPTGVALAPQRRRELVEWAVAGERLVVEHDYDAHFRYDRPPAGTLQALAPEHVAYVGSASALLAPTLRLGWAVVPARLVTPLAEHVFATAVAAPRLPQLALAELIERGHLDRHLRRARTAYRRRRDLARSMLDVRGAAVGLFHYVPVEDETAVLAAARGRGIAVDGVNEHAIEAQPPALAVGFAALAEPTLQGALRELSGAATSAARRRP
jgi:GntR family transcriptional regulator / MocR family aminotransferase